MLSKIQMNPVFRCPVFRWLLYTTQISCKLLFSCYWTGLDDGKAEKLLLETFRRHSALAVKQAQDKKKRFEEMDRKKKERAELDRKKEEEELKKRYANQIQ